MMIQAVWYESTAKFSGFNQQWFECSQFNRLESVKELIYYCGELDFVHMYDLCRRNFHLKCVLISPTVPVF